MAQSTYTKMLQKAKKIVEAPIIKSFDKLNSNSGYVIGIQRIEGNNIKYFLKPNHQKMFNVRINSYEIKNNNKTMYISSMDNLEIRKSNIDINTKDISKKIDKIQGEIEKELYELNQAIKKELETYNQKLLETYIVMSKEDQNFYVANFKVFEEEKKMIASQNNDFLAFHYCS